MLEKKVEKELNLDDLSFEELQDLYNHIKELKIKRYKASDEYVKRQICRTISYINRRGDIFGDDFVDEAFEYMQKIKKIKENTEE